MKYITLFEQQTAFDNAKSTLDKPNMSLVTETGNVYSLSVGGGVTYEYVDLGLSVMWAKCNVGAKNETDYGSYFQWGDIINKTNADCSWSTYKHCNGSSTTLTKYNNNKSFGTEDNKSTLDPEDDAAAQIMGGNWRIPTQTEFQELIDGTVNQWVTDYNGTGVNGWKFTHKTDTSKYIFIPAAGNCKDGSVGSVGRSGNVWSSSLVTSSPGDAWFLGFGSSYCSMVSNYRYYGRSVRGVRK